MYLSTKLKIYMVFPSKTKYHHVLHRLSVEINFKLGVFNQKKSMDRLFSLFTQELKSQFDSLA